MFYILEIIKYLTFNLFLWQYAFFFPCFLSCSFILQNEDLRRIHRLLKEVSNVLPLLITAFIAELLVEELELIHTFFVCIDHSSKKLLHV